MEPYSSDDIKRRKKKQYPDKFNPEDQLCPYCRAASKCLALVSDAQRRIYIWKGRESSVRARFLGNRVAYEIRDQLGRDYRIIPVDEGQYVWRYQERTPQSLRGERVSPALWEEGDRVEIQTIGLTEAGF